MKQSDQLAMLETTIADITVAIADIQMDLGLACAKVTKIAHYFADSASEASSEHNTLLSQ